MRKVFSWHFNQYSILFPGLAFLLLFIVQATQAYNPATATQYAIDNWDQRNRDYITTYQADCANYVSQCLIEGGMDLSQDESVYVDSAGAIPRVLDLDLHLRNFQHAQVTEGHFSGDAPVNLCAGDVVIYMDNDKTHRHATFVVSGTGENALLNMHSEDHENRNIDFQANYFLSQYGSSNITFYHFQTFAETGNDYTFYGTGGYVGDKSLIAVVSKPGSNYMGYIVNNPNVIGQDMVIGEDTSLLNGCAHYISAYCTDAGKGIPQAGQVFNSPWTNTSSEHWAYWVRKAVLYGNQFHSVSSDILSAVWYITDRAGQYNYILVNIGYPENGPDKNISGSASGLNDNSIKLVHNKFNPMRGESVSIHFRHTKQSRVSIKIYTIDAELVYTVLDNAILNPGMHTYHWNGKNMFFSYVASGIYFLHIETNTFKSTKKICIIK